MKSCLVVDDSSVIRKVARRILEGMQFEITEAEDGEQALGACQRQLPDAILLDWNMPKMDGYEFLKALRCTYRACAPRRSERVHHEAVRQRDRRSQVPRGRTAPGGLIGSADFAFKFGCVSRE